MMALLAVCSLDAKKTYELQNIYGEWYLQSHNWDEYSNEQIQSFLLKAISDGCYRAFQLVYENKLNNRDDIDNLHEIYWDTLIRSGGYGKAIKFAYECQYIGAESREKYIVKAICGNFAKHSFSQNGLLIFDEDFTIADAIDILSRNFVVNDYAWPVVSKDGAYLMVYFVGNAPEADNRYNSPPSNRVDLAKPNAR